MARIFHGIPSPKYPGTDWYRSNFWGRYSSVDFNVIKTTATKVLIEVKTRGKLPVLPAPSSSSSSSSSAAAVLDVRDHAVA